MCIVFGGVMTPWCPRPAPCPCHAADIRLLTGESWFSVNRALALWESPLWTPLCPVHEAGVVIPSPGIVIPGDGGGGPRASRRLQADACEQMRSGQYSPHWVREAMSFTRCEGRIRLVWGKPVWPSQDCEKIGDAASYETTENSAKYLSLLLDAWCLGWERIPEITQCKRPPDQPFSQYDARAHSAHCIVGCAREMREFRTAGHQTACSPK